MCSVARGKTWAGRMLTSASSAWNAASYASAISAGVLCSRPGRDEHRVRAAVEALVAQVADVGDVLDVEDLDAVVEQRPPDQVGQQVAAQVADVGVAVDGRAAGVHPRPGRARAARPVRPAGSGCCAVAGSSAPSYASAISSARAALTFRVEPRYPIRGLAVLIPSFPRRCGPARPHSMPGRRLEQGPSADPPYTPGDAPPDRLRRARDAVRLVRGVGRRPAPDRPRPDPDRRARRRSIRPPRATPAARRSRPSCSSR